MQTPKILVVDDEPAIANLVSSYLKREGYEVFLADNGPAAVETARTRRPDIIILDQMLPGFDGLEVLNRVRQDSTVYVIMLTAKTEELDKVLGLSMGADDYLTKPFSPRELTARVKAVLRRIQLSAQSTAINTFLEFKHIKIDLAAHLVWANNELIDLTSIEYNLLSTLATHKGIVLSREQFLDRIWDTNYFGDLRVVDVHIGHLRQKLGEAGFVITTVRGAGYRFDDEKI